MGTLMAGATVAPSSVRCGGGSVEDEAAVVEVDVRWKGETLSMRLSVTESRQERDAPVTAQLSMAVDLGQVKLSDRPDPLNNSALVPPPHNLCR